jgi:hypothetical protein
MRFNVGLLALLMVGLVAVAGSVAAFGFGGITHKDTAVQDAIAAGDFAAWKQAIEAELTEDNFKQAVAMHKQMAAEMGNSTSGTGGKFRDDGIARDNGSAADPAKAAAVRDAVEAGDYDAWKTAVEAMGMNSSKVMSEGDFNLLVELHQARVSGDTAKADELMTELKTDGVNDFGMGFGGMGMAGRGMGQGMGGGAGRRHGMGLQPEAQAQAAAATTD